MTVIKIGIAQFHSPSLSGSLTYVRTLLDKGAELVLLPEKWMNGDDGNSVSEGHNFLKSIAGLAAEYSAAVLTGGVVEREGSSDYISCYAFGPDGNLLAKHRKLHPFGLEKRRITPGKEISHFDFRGLKVGLAICYDMDFPETARRLALADCDIVAVPAKIRKEGMDPWLAYLQTRTLENRLPVAFANDVSPPHFLGGSGLVDLTRSDDGMVMYPRLRSMGNEAGGEIFEVEPELYRADRRSRLSERNESTDMLLDADGNGI